MTKRDLFWRLAGLGLLMAAGGSTLLHRAVWLTAKSGPAPGLEAMLGLATFMLACLGVLLIINGARLRDSWKATLDNREPKAPFEAHKRAKRMSENNLTADFVRIGSVDGRTMLAAMLILRARERERKEAAWPCCRDATEFSSIIPCGKRGSIAESAALDASALDLSASRSRDALSNCSSIGSRVRRMIMHWGAVAWPPPDLSATQLVTKDVGQSSHGPTKPTGRALPK